MLRIYLGDNNPDEYYSFCPPDVPNLTLSVRKGRKYVWTNEELWLAMDLGFSLANSLLKEKSGSLSVMWDNRKAILFLASAIQALRMVVPRWINNNFEYNIGGLSVTVNKSENYQSFLDALTSNLESMIESVNTNLERATLGVVGASSGYINTRVS